MKLAFAFATCLLCMPARAQSVQQSNVKTPSLPDSFFKSYLQAGLAIESEKKPNTFFEFDYCFSPDRQRKYFVGFGMDVARRQSTDHDYSYNDHTGTFRNKASLYSIHLTQKYIFRPTERITPFMGVNVGLRTFNQDVSFKYVTIVSPLFPIPIPVTEKIYSSKQHSLNISGTLGLMFRLNDIAAIVSSVSIRSSKEIEMYEGDRKPACAGFTLGVLVGRVAGQSRKRTSSPPVIQEKKSQPKKVDDSDGF